MIGSYRSFPSFRILGATIVDTMNHLRDWDQQSSVFSNKLETQY